MTTDNPDIIAVYLGASTDGKIHEYCTNVKNQTISDRIVPDGDVAPELLAQVKENARQFIHFNQVLVWHKPDYYFACGEGPNAWHPVTGSACNVLDQFDLSDIDFGHTCAPAHSR